MAHFHKNAAVEDYSIKFERLCLPLNIVHNATPALVVGSVMSSLASVGTLALEGQTALALAIDSGTNFTSPSSASGVFGILMANLGTIDRIYTYQILNPSSGSISSVVPVGLNSSGVTASGNIALSVTWSGNLSTTDLSAVLCIDYSIRKA